MAKDDNSMVLTFRCLNGLEGDPSAETGNRAQRADRRRGRHRQALAEIDPRQRIVGPRRRRVATEIGGSAVVASTGTLASATTISCRSGATSRTRKTTDRALTQSSRFMRRLPRAVRRSISSRLGVSPPKALRLVEARICNASAACFEHG
jgi:hypothetical protein